MLKKFPKMTGKKVVTREIIELVGFILRTNEIFEPLCDVFEKDGKFYIDLDIAGLDEQNLKIDIYNNSVSVIGIKKKNSINDAKYVRAERIFGPFRKIVNFPGEIKNIDSVSYKKGILRIVVSKG